MRVSSLAAADRIARSPSVPRPPDQAGTAATTITLADPDGASASSSFLLTVNPVNDPPTISRVPDQTTDEDVPTPAIPITISDVETAADNLTVAGSSSNQG